MPIYHPDLDTAALFDWPAVRETDVRWQGLLLGNGASIAVADSFSYPSLFEVARGGSVARPLPASAQQLFAELATTNFEFVLASLKLASRVCAAAGVDGSSLPTLYASAQHALFDAVGHVHVDWEIVADRTLTAIRAELLAYKRVYSTNYDLLVYWAMMRQGDPNDFRDYFWASGHFDATDVEVWGRPTVVLFPHGGIHLRRTPTGGTYKRSSGEQSLLAQFETDWATDETPLLISEGSSTDKLLSINRSDYLSFAYTSFARHEGNLVVFGHALREEDDHLVHAMNQWGSEGNPRQIAISVRRQPGERVIRQEKARLAQRLPNADLWFYDADTHPLGEPHVRP